MTAPAVTPVVADTRVFVWYVQGSPTLSKRPAAHLDVVTAAGEPIFVSAVTLVELRYLVEKSTFSADEAAALRGVVAEQDSAFEITPVDEGIADAVSRGAREAVGDPWNQMIAATALALGVPLVTADRKLHRLDDPTVIW